MVFIGGASSAETNDGVVPWTSPVNVITVIGEHCISLSPIRDHNSLEGVMLYNILCKKNHYHIPLTCESHRSSASFHLSSFRNSGKYWWKLNLAIEPKITITRILADFKFGGSVQDRHTYICE